jgi:Resolvase, N terminal domain
MGHLIGYARVSTADQDFGLQLAALRRAGCPDERIFRDTASGARQPGRAWRRAYRRWPPATPWWSGVWIDSGGRWRIW